MCVCVRVCLKVRSSDAMVIGNVQGLEFVLLLLFLKDDATIYIFKRGFYSNFLINNNVWF